MHRTRSLLMVLMMLTLLVAFRANATLVPYPLEKMVNKAELIVIGEVIRLERTNIKFKNYRRPLNRATIQIETVLKGERGKQEVDVFYLPVVEQPDFKMGERAIVFIYTFEDRYWVVQGMMGEVIIESKLKPDLTREEVVEPFNIVGENHEQPLDEFLGKIRTLLQGQKE